jgi:hypothetical protein
LLAQLADSASTPDDLKRIAKSRLGTAQAHGNPQPAS